MANNFDSNITRKLARVFLDEFETARIMSKNVNTQLLKTHSFNPSSGDTIDFKRPTDYKSKRTVDGDISALTRSDIVTGKASGIVQDYFTVDVDFASVDEAIRMDQLKELLAPMATRIVTDLELDFARFMMANSGHVAGTPGVAASKWDHLAEGGAVLTSAGVPSDHPWFYGVNPYTQTKLSSDQRSLGAGGSAGSLIKTAHQKATITEMFAGFDRVMTATTLPSYSTGAGADREGTLTANPNVTYLAAKDSMKQTLAVTGFAANLAVAAGETIQIAGVSRLNLSTRQPVLDDTGSAVVFTATVAEAVVLGASGEGNIVITGPAIWEADGAFNTVDVAPVSGGVVSLFGAESTLIQPNLFWHKNAFGIGFVPQKKLYSTDTIATTKDGVQMRVSKYADGDKNQQICRFDLLPAYAALNPFLAGLGYGRT